MILASVNANKRLGTTAGRERFQAWLERREVALVVVQEGWRAGAAVPAPPPGMRFLDGDAELAAWICGTAGWPRVERPATWWQTVLVGELAIHSVHLDPNRVATRIAQLHILAERLPANDNIVLGDFNLALARSMASTASRLAGSSRLGSAARSLSCSRGAHWRMQPRATRPSSR